MSQNVIQVLWYYGIVEMRDKTRTRFIHSLFLYLPFFRPAAAGRYMEEWRNADAGRHRERSAGSSVPACRCKTCFFLHRPIGRIRLSRLLAQKGCPARGIRQSGAVAAREAHNLEAAGSNPASATSSHFQVFSPFSERHSRLRVLFCILTNPNR